MRKALVLHPFSGRIEGGAVRVAAAIVHTLQEANFHTHFATYGPIDNIWSIDELGKRPDKIFRAFPYTLTYKYGSGVIGCAAASLYSLSYDIIVNSSYNPLLGYADLGYVHVLSRRVFGVRDLTKGNAIDEIPSLVLSQTLGRIKAKTIVANSTWTARKIFEKTGLNVRLLFPPVKVFECSGTSSKEDLVIGLGRISPEKKWEDFIEVAKRVRTRLNVKFLIMGSVSNQTYFEKIRSLSNGSVSFCPNLSEKEKIYNLCKSKVMLHTFKGEHFGIAVVEAMLAKSIPIVYKDGGAWEDIVERGRFGYGYENIEEAVDCLVGALENKNLGKEIQQKALQFSEENFRLRLRKLLNI